MELFYASQLDGAKGLAFDGAQAHIVTRDGDIVATITLQPGFFDPVQFRKHIDVDEQIGFDNVRLSGPGNLRAIPVARGELETKANADWQPSSEDRERRRFEAKLNNLQKQVDGQVDKAVKAALAAQSAVVDEVDKPEDKPDDKPADKPDDKAKPKSDDKSDDKAE